MGSHPLNLGLRFLLELAALGSLSMFAWVRFDGPLKWAAVFGLPLLFMVLWGTFAVPGDPSRSGSAPVSTPGAVRLGLELCLFGAAFVLLWVSRINLSVEGISIPVEVGLIQFLIGAIIATGIGLVAGIIPAIRASRRDRTGAVAGTEFSSGPRPLA